MNLYFILSQIAVFIALIFQFISFQQKDRHYILGFLLITASAMAMHYYFLDQNVAAILNILACIRLLVAYRYSFEFIGEVFLISNFVIFGLIFSSALDIFPLLIMSFATMGSFQKDEKSLRILFLLSVLFGLCYSFIIQSPVGCIFYFSAIVSNYLGYRKYYLLSR